MITTIGRGGRQPNWVRVGSSLFLAPPIIIIIIVIVIIMTITMYAIITSITTIITIINTSTSTTINYHQ